MSNEYSKEQMEQMKKDRARFIGICSLDENYVELPEKNRAIIDAALQTYGDNDPDKGAQMIIEKLGNRKPQP